MRTGAPSSSPWLLVVVAFVVSSVGAYILYLTFGQQDAAAPPPVTTDMRWIDSAPTILRADEDGAIVMVDNLVRGVSRSGDTVWQQTSHSSPENQACLERCPAAVLSGDSSPLGADPSPEVHGKATLPNDWDDVTGGVNVILAVQNQGSLRAVSDAKGVGRLESLRRDGTIEAYPLPVPDAEIAMVDGDQSGQVIAPTDNPSQALPYLVRLTSQGWDVTATKGSRACTSADGKRVVVGNTYTVNGARVSLPRTIGPDVTCRMSRELVIFGYSGGSADQDATVLDSAGHVVATIPIPGEAGHLSVSPGTDQFAVSDVTPGSQHVTLYGRSGDKVRTYDGATSLRFLPTGGFVMADVDGNLTWHKAG